MGGPGSCCIFELHQCLIVPVPVTITTQSADTIESRVLQEVEKRSVKRIIMDLSEVTVLDSRVFRILYDTAGMAELMGAKTVFTGLQPGVAVALVDLGIDSEEIRTAPDLNDGISLLEMGP